MRKMDTIIWILILLTVFNFLLKQTFWSIKSVCIAALIAGGFVVIMWPYAIEQSKAQIADWLPGILILPVLFFGLTQLIYALPGISFQQVAWGFGLVVIVVIPLCHWFLRWIIPEEDLRLELLFLTNALVAILGVIATVNGRTAVEGTATVDWLAFVGCVTIFVMGAGVGMLIRGIKRRHL